MDIPPPKPPRSKKRAQRITSSPTDSLPSDENDAGSYVEKSLETSEDLEQCLPANGVCGDGMSIEEKADVLLEDRAEASVEETVNVPVEESAETPMNDPENLEFHVGEDTALTDTNVSNSPVPISYENTVMDDGMQSPSAVQQTVLAPTVSSLPESPSITIHNGNHSPDRVVEEVKPSGEISVSPPHSPRSDASPAHGLDHVDSPQSGHESSDSVFTEEHTQDNSEPLVQSPRAFNETTEREPDTCYNTQHKPASSSSSPKGCTTEELNTRPTSCPEITHPASIPPRSTSTTESSLTTTPPHTGIKGRHSSQAANDGAHEQEGDFKDKEVKVKTRRIKDDSSWIGRKQNWGSSSSQQMPRPSSDSATHPSSLQAKRTASVSGTGTEDFQTAGNSQSSSQGDGNEADGEIPMRSWRSSDRLTVSVNENQFSRRAVRSRSFNSATLNRIGDKVRIGMLIFLYVRVFHKGLFLLSGC